MPTNGLPTFPNYGAQSQDPASRLAEIQAKWKQFPGRAPNGTGPTGLNPDDAQGWSDMENEQTEALRLQDQLGGKAGPTIRVGRQSALAGIHDATDPYAGLDPNSTTSLSDQESAMGYDPNSTTSLRKQLALRGLQGA